MERAVLFRFHENPDICEERLEILRQLNPDTKIFGLGERIEGLGRLEKYMEDLFVIEDRSSRWKWLNGDLAVRRWFDEEGNKYPFDMLHLVEWDLLLTEPLDEVYGGISRGQLGLTGLKPIQEAADYGWDWVTGEKYGKEWEELKRHVAENLGFERSSYGCIFPGTCLPREFLKRYSEVEVPELCNDEVLVPLFTEAMGFELKDTGFFGDWGDEKVYRYFNARSDGDIDKESIREQLENPDGRRAFPPFRDSITIEEIREMKSE